MQIKLCFGGWLTAPVSEVWDPLNDTMIPVTDSNQEHILEMIKAGKYCLNLSLMLKESINSYVEMFDFEEDK